VSFFEAPPPRPPQPHELPPWLGPNGRELGVTVVVERDVARTDDAVVSVRSLSAHSTGFAVSVVACRRAPAEDAGGLGGHWHPTMGGEPPPDFLRFGVQLSDGSKATNLDEFPGFETAPAGPVLSPRGSSGGAGRQDLSCWIWPLPPSGRLELVCEWPAENIPESRIELDADEILAAAKRARPIWE
jgi:hypothetical protein